MISPLILWEPFTYLWWLTLIKYLLLFAVILNDIFNIWMDKFIYLHINKIEIFHRRELATNTTICVEYLDYISTYQSLLTMLLLLFNLIANVFTNIYLD